MKREDIKWKRKLYYIDAKKIIGSTEETGYEIGIKDAELKSKDIKLKRRYNTL